MLSSAAETTATRIALLSRSRWRVPFACPDAHDGPLFAALTRRRNESTRASSDRSSSSSSSTLSSSSSSPQPNPNQNNPPPPPPPPPPHWLDRRAPRAAEWLDAKSRELWLRGLEERCGSGQFPLGGREQLLRRLVSEGAERLMRRHAAGRLAPPPPPSHSHSSSDCSAAFAADYDGRSGAATMTATGTATSRERTHLQAAALAKATGDALLPFFRGDEEKVAGILLDAAGGRVSGPLRALLRLEAGLASALSRLLPFLPASPSPFGPLGDGGGTGSGEGGLAERRLRLLRSDYGGAWPGAEVVVEVEGGREGGAGEGEEKKKEKKEENGGESETTVVTRRLRTTTTTLRVPSCLYHEMMTTSSTPSPSSSTSSSSPSSSSSSPPPRWLNACCCSVDGVWFEPWAAAEKDDGRFKNDATTASAASPSSFEPSVSFRRRRWLGAGDDACELCVTRVEVV